MNLKTAAIQPRSRRPPANRGHERAEPLADPRTRVLIQIPWVEFALDPVGRKATPQAVEMKPAVSPAPAEVASIAAGLSPAAPSAALPPKAAPPPRETRSHLRIDAAHSPVPAPHTVAPSWSPRSERLHIKLVRQPAIWLATLVGTIVIAILLVRGGADAEKSREAVPAANLGKREIKDRVDESPTDSASNNQPSARMAQAASASKNKRATQSVTNTGPVFPNAAPPVGTNSGLIRRVAPNTPASLVDQHGLPAQATMAPAAHDDNDRPGGAPTRFELQETLQFDAAPVTDSGTQSPSSPSGVERGASLQGTILHYQR